MHALQPSYCSTHTTTLELLVKFHYNLLWLSNIYIGTVLVHYKMTIDDRLMTVEERWSNERLTDVCKIWNFNEGQKVALQELQHRIKDIDHWKNDPYEVVRWYNEFHGDLTKTERLFRYTIQWRLEHDVDSHLESYGDPHPMFHYYPVGILEGTDKQGDAIYLDRIGAADSYTLMKEFGIQGVVDYMIFFYEYISRREFWQQHEQRTGRRVTNFLVIIDLHGLNAGHMRPGLLPLLQKVSRMTQDCYAGWGKVCFVPPTIFPASRKGVILSF
jgi:CRAL/TRIO domain